MWQEYKTFLHWCYRLPSKTRLFGPTRVNISNNISHPLSCFYTAAHNPDHQTDQHKDHATSIPSEKPFSNTGSTPVYWCRFKPSLVPSITEWSCFNTVECWFAFFQISSLFAVTSFWRNFCPRDPIPDKPLANPGFALYILAFDTSSTSGR